MSVVIRGANPKPAVVPTSGLRRRPPSLSACHVDSCTAAVAIGLLRCVAVEGEWISDRAGIWVEWTLRQTVQQRGFAERQAPACAESGENIVGSYGRGSVTHNQPQYRTVVLTHSTGTRTQRQDGGTAVKPPYSFFGHSFNLDGLGSKKCRDRLVDFCRVDAGQHQFPFAGFEFVRKRALTCNNDIDNVDTGRQGGVERCLHLAGITDLRQANFEIFGFRGSTGRRGIRIRDFWMRGKPGRKADGRPGASHGSFKRPAKIPVAGEPQSATLGITDAELLHDRQLRIGRFGIRDSRQRDHSPRLPGGPFLPAVNKDGQVATDAATAKRGKVFVLISIILLALSLRSVPASAGVLLSVLRQEFGFSVAVGGILTTLPVLCFAVFGLTAARLMAALGVHRTAVFAQALMAVGLIMRGYAGDTAVLFLGSTIALSGAAIGNIMLPPLVKLHFPHRVAAVSALATAGIVGGATLASVLSVPVAHATGNWRDGLLIWAWLAIAVMVPWLFLLRGDSGKNAKPTRRKSTLGIRQAARSPLAWAMAIFFGLQSAQAYTTFGWMPEIYADAGLSPAAAANMLGICAFMGVPVALAIPATLRRFGSSGLIWIFGVLQFSGWIGLMALPGTMPWLWAITIGLGGGAFPWVMTMIGIKVRTVDGAASLSGFTQSVGYLIAAAGPLGVGILHDATGGWTVPLLCMSMLSIPLVMTGLYTIRAKRFEDQLRVA